MRILRFLKTILRTLFKIFRYCLGFLSVYIIIISICAGIGYVSSLFYNFGISGFCGYTAIGLFVFIGLIAIPVIIVILNDMFNFLKKVWRESEDFVEED